MIPYVNATLTAISGGYTGEEYDSTNTPATPAWTGSEPIYVEDRLVEVESPGRVDEVRKTRVEVGYAVGSLVSRGDVVSFVLEGTSLTRTVEDLIRTPLLDRVRLVMEDT